MQELRLVAVSEDGTYLVLASAGRGTRFTLPVDDSLRAAARGQFSRLGQYEIEVESPLRPKEIQARIRAGETAESIAQVAGIPLERVRWFEGPVLQEREYVAQQAQRVPMRRADGGGPGPQLGEIVAERLGRRGVDSEEAEWDSWKREDGTWRVRLRFDQAGESKLAEWIYDPRRRLVQPLDDDAHMLSSPEAVDTAAPEEITGTVTPFVPRLQSVPEPPATEAPAPPPMPRAPESEPHTRPAERPAATPAPAPAAEQPHPEPAHAEPIHAEPARHEETASECEATYAREAGAIREAGAVRDGEAARDTAAVRDGEAARDTAAVREAGDAVETETVREPEPAPTQEPVRETAAQARPARPRAEQTEIPTGPQPTVAEPEPAAATPPPAASSQPAATQPAASQPAASTESAAPSPKDTAPAARGGTNGSRGSGGSGGKSGRKKQARKDRPAERPAAAAQPPEEQPKVAAAGGAAGGNGAAQQPAPQPRRGGRKGRRASVPSWDEIMFGAKRED